MNGSMLWQTTTNGTDLSSLSMPSIAALEINNESVHQLLVTDAPETASSSAGPPIAPWTVFQLCEWYSANLHGVLSATICVLGICCNLVNAVVLTRRTMFGQVRSLLLFRSSQHL